MTSKGDPLFFRSGGREEWGLEYLWGMFEPGEDTTEFDVPGRRIDTKHSDSEEFDTVGELSARFGGTYTALWAHDETEELEQFKKFMQMLIERYEKLGTFHVYHYHVYEISALQRIAERNGVYRDELGNFIKMGMFIDLLPVLKRSTTISQASYSIKKVEPAYMGGIVRLEELNNAGDSISVYANAARQMRSEMSESDSAIPSDDVQAQFNLLELYNEYDVVSTMLIHQWLINQARAMKPHLDLWGPMDAGDRPDLPPMVEYSEPVIELDENDEPLNKELSDFLIAKADLRVCGRELEQLIFDAHGNEFDNGPLTEHLKMLWGLSQYFAIEELPDTVDLINRLTNELSDWERDLDALVLTDLQEIPDKNGTTGWKRGPRKTWRRDFTCSIESASAENSLRFPSENRLAIYYEGGIPEGEEDNMWGPDEALRIRRLGGSVVKPKDENGESSTVTTIHEDGRLHFYESRQTESKPDWSDLPSAIRLEEFVPQTAIMEAVNVFLNRILDQLPETGPVPPEYARQLGAKEKQSPQWNLLSREVTFVDTEGVEPRQLMADLYHTIKTSPEGSVIAVQGPPGTGKTFTASRVIASLVGIDRWKVAVTAQSHATITNVLAGVRKVFPKDLKALGIDPASIPARSQDQFELGQETPDQHITEPLTVPVLPPQIVGQRTDAKKAGKANQWGEARKILAAGVLKDNERLSELKDWSLLHGDYFDIYSYVAAGCPATIDGKKVAKTNFAAREDAFKAEPGPLVFGGTAWAQIECINTDLLVIDEAAQFSLAYTIAAASKAKRILLLGDPQQLPQVSQGKHTVPADSSALGWWVDEAEVIDPKRGYFLEETYRMPDPLTKRVSDLSYNGKLVAAVPPNQRAMVRTDNEDTNVPCGVFGEEVQHTGRTIRSPEEADKVVELINSAINEFAWCIPEDSTATMSKRPLTQADFLVVAPYNAQVGLIRRTLQDHGLGDVEVGTVDKFQGREAPIVIVSMTASDVDASPRGPEFVLNRNRLNVAISRAQWKSYVVHSPRLAQWQPNSVKNVELLGAFLRAIRPYGS